MNYCVERTVNLTRISWFLGSLWSVVSFAGLVTVAGTCGEDVAPSVDTLLAPAASGTIAVKEKAERSFRCVLCTENWWKESRGCRSAFIAYRH